MIWLLRHAGRVLYRGTYIGAIEAAEQIGACERSFTTDRTERAPLLARGYQIVPEARRAGRRAAA